MTMQTAISEDLRRELERLVAAARLVSADVGREVERVLSLGRIQPLDHEELVRLLQRTIEILRDGARHRGDRHALESLQADVQGLIDRIVEARNPKETPAHRKRKEFKQILMAEHNGITARPVIPSPWFHEKEIPMFCGFVRTTDIVLWEENVRLDIHLAQFRQQFGRGPTPEELLEIMLGKLRLPGVDKDDQFEIVELARSIANNGVRKPPILDTDGTLLDGNRRVAACHYILHSDEFTTEQKKRAEYIFVWQLMEHATADDRERVVVSLNFESDYKQDWPDYVKARKIFDEWQGMLALEYPPPNQRRQAELKRDLSRRFALGPNTTEVTRYLRMVNWADEFEDYHINRCTRNAFEVKHKANKYFQYFDELSKGTSPGKVQYALNQDEALKHLAFELLFQGKFKNWTQIRALAFIARNEEARERLQKARDVQLRTEDDLDDAQEMVQEAIDIARVNRPEVRTLGANSQIERFVKWLEELPVKAFRDDVKPENLRRLLKALRLVRRYAEQVLGEKHKDGGRK